MIQPIIIGDYRGRRTPIQRNTSGSIRRISGGKLHFRTEGPLKLNKDFRFTIIFEQNRITHQMKQFALDIVNGAGIMNFLFPSSISSEPSPQPEKWDWIRKTWLDADFMDMYCIFFLCSFHCIGESLNPEQKLAVTGALAKSEVPFLIFGPPGENRLIAFQIVYKIFMFDFVHRNGQNEDHGRGHRSNYLKFRSKGSRMRELELGMRWNRFQINQIENGCIDSPNVFNKNEKEEYTQRSAALLELWRGREGIELAWIVQA